MAALPKVPNVLLAQFQHTYGGQPAWVHWYFRYTGQPPTVTDAGAIANSLKSAWVTNMAPLCPANVTLVTVRVTDLSSDTGAQNQSTGTSAGTRTGTILTSGDSVLVNAHIARRYRGGRPRQYWPLGVAGDLSGPSAWTATFQSAVSAAINAMVSAAAAITWTGGGTLAPVNVSYYKGFTVQTHPGTGRAENVPTPRPSPVVDTILSSSINPNVATQRRRLALD